MAAPFFHLFQTRSGATIAVLAPEREASWLQSVWRRNPCPAKALAEMGYDIEVRLPPASEVAS